ncbi:MAG: hypothetical protein F4Y08_05795 [Caldilineaceae bacterium SB0662_bin_9]|uniref:beta-galactosidase n=1 Tax=Caldilineaceae bacterium SB0662_bin_9 TaxID=2605258 RepID=A0A6B1DQG0_9CHLR|nr:hypothetical protein [Caldilineaceae bacterium SB0666_bin_21]MYD89840.1 hypothetical protein [Caldilineaceae bacterium SB0662_bin_9]
MSDTASNALPHRDPALALWPRQPTLHMPDQVADVASPVVSLDGDWKFHPHPPDGFWRAAVRKDAWKALPVPSCTFSHGYDLEEGEEYAYARMVDIPYDFVGQRMFLRFDGVTGKARVWIDGNPIRSHFGGYTTWFAEITDRVVPGTPAEIVVGVADAQSELCVFNLGGIIRPVSLVAVPPTHLSRCHVDTSLTDDHRTADITLAVGVDGSSLSGLSLVVELTDPTGEVVAGGNGTWALPQDSPDSTIDLSIGADYLWDAEHPYLYRLEATLMRDGRMLQQVSRRFGIRQVEVDGQELLINGRPVKLRGVNRHDVALLTGRTLTPEQLEQDVLLFREANVNFIRTSHYPPREDFLELCDRHGIYVEDEAAVAFIGQFIQCVQNDPDFTAQFMDQMAEQVERHRSHPCVIMWSLANECYWGTNFHKCFDYVKAADPSRPVLFSYPNTMPEGAPACDIWSSHYANWDSDPSAMSDTWSQHGPGLSPMPVLHDEYAHGTCYNMSEQHRDPAVREFWGESIKRWWENIFTTPGALGGAIWGGIDDEIITNSGYTVNREWGLIDGWRRRKPEHWLTKKAYSPIRITDRTLPAPQVDGSALVAVANWFDHTDLNELDIVWHQDEETWGQVECPSIPPRAQGLLRIPAAPVSSGRPVYLMFSKRGLESTDGYDVDEFMLSPASESMATAPTVSEAPRLVETNGALEVRHADLSLSLSRETGMLSGSVDGERILEGGPHLVLTGYPLPEWQATSVAGRQEDGAVVLDIAGCHGELQVEYSIRVDGTGLLDLSYRLPVQPFPSPRRRGLRAGRDVGGFREVGVAFDLTHEVDCVSWRRNGLWSLYPDDHIGRNEGVASRNRAKGDETFRQEPDWSWGEDMRGYSLFGRYDFGRRGTNDFRAMKHSIRQASALVAGSEARFSAVSDKDDAVRLEVLPDPDFQCTGDGLLRHVTGNWVQAVPGSNRDLMSNKTGDFAEFQFEGPGVAWLGSRDNIHGMARVLLDGKEVAVVDLFCGILHGVARGELKFENEILFSCEGLAPGSHTLRIEVLGEKNPESDAAYVSVSGFRVLKDGGRDRIRFHIVNEWNYPELTWGNYMKPPIGIGSGYANRVQARMHGA